jgi:hypothetical protein
VAERYITPQPETARGSELDLLCIHLLIFERRTDLRKEAHEWEYHDIARTRKDHIESVKLPSESMINSKLDVTSEILTTKASVR